MNLKVTILAGAGALALAMGAQAATLPADWVVEGNVGTGTPNGVVTAPPAEGPGYYYVSTSGGLSGVGALEGVGGSGYPTNGSVVTTGLFNALAGEALEFFFNYVTSDGAGFADYGWARVLDAANEQIALLFTARTAPSGSIVPGFSMPDPAATLEPASVEIIGGGPAWDALGSSSGSCFAAGCGYTGWVKSTYEFAADTEFKLQFGVTNWNDQIYHSGMAFAGAKIGDVIITPPPVSEVPLPAAGLLLLAGLGGLIGLRRRAA